LLQTVEEIAKRHHFPQAINQIKTAREACINAIEHSLSPDRKIYQNSRSSRQDRHYSIKSWTSAGRRKGFDRGPRAAARLGPEFDEGLMDEVTIERSMTAPDTNDEVPKNRGK
jgi:anti-sigma regulatory factor (Ser/Thr protein kinase)